MDIVEILTMSKNKANNNHGIMSIEDSSSYPDGHDHDLELGLSIGGGLRTKEEASRVLTSQDFLNLKPSSSLSSSSSSSSTVNNGVHSVSPPNATSVVGWPPIRKAHHATILANRIKSKHEELRSRLKTNKQGHHLSVKVNMDGTLIGRKVDLYAHDSYESLAHTLDNMFCEKWSSNGGGSSSRLLNETSEFVLTYEDKDGDCLLVGDVPWRMFLSSVKRLRILRNPKMQQH